jgi:hypothetical protein
MTSIVRTVRQKTEREVLAEIRAALNALSFCRVYRNNTGKMQNVRGGVVRFGLGIGSPDLVGWVSLATVARFFALEVKRSERSKPTREQREWIGRINSAGGYASVVSSAAQALQCAYDAAAGKAAPPC